MTCPDVPWGMHVQLWKGKIAGRAVVETEINVKGIFFKLQKLALKGINTKQ